jgi:hypothetical protein
VGSGTRPVQTKLCNNLKCSIQDKSYGIILEESFCFICAENIGVQLPLLFLLAGMDLFLVFCG